MSIPVDYLIFFAVKEEARFFDPSGHPVVLTGIGRRNTLRELHRALGRFQPQCVLTCGFAGGLNSAYPRGTVLFDEDLGVGLAPSLQRLGAIPAEFHCSRRVAITAREKTELRKSSGADAVEMESSVIRTVCRERKIASATIRVISDAAEDDLPLDFNALLTGEDRIDMPRLLWNLIVSPRKIPQLIEFQKQTVAASRRLGAVLEELLQEPRSV